jgi:hypothetical protein
VAIAVVLFFFLSVPVENTYVDKGNYASLGTDGLFVRHSFPIFGNDLGNRSFQTAATQEDEYQK